MCVFLGALFGLTDGRPAVGTDRKRHPLHLVGNDIVRDMVLREHAQYKHRVLHHSRLGVDGRRRYHW